MLSSSLAVIISSVWYSIFNSTSPGPEILPNLARFVFLWILFQLTPLLQGEIETLEVKFLLCIMPLFQCLKVCLTLLVDLVGIPVVKKDDIHNTYKISKMDIIYPYISILLCAGNRSNSVTGEKLLKKKKDLRKKIIFRNVRTGLWSWQMVTCG